MSCGSAAPTAATATPSCSSRAPAPPSSRCSPTTRPRRALEQTAELLWQGWRFQDAGARLYVHRRRAARAAPRHERRGGRRVALRRAARVLPPTAVPAACGRASPTTPPTSRWTAPSAPRARCADGAHELSILAVLGLRPDRPGDLAAAPPRSSSATMRPRRAPRGAVARGRAALRERDPRRRAQGLSHPRHRERARSARAARAPRHLDTHPRSLLSRPGTDAPDESALPHVVVE